MTCDLQSLNFELSNLKPPIPRDRLIFEEVLVKGRGQQEVAQEHGISQPRVSKILAEVGVWLCRVLPESVATERPEGQVALGFWLARARLDFLYHKAVAAFEASGQVQTTFKERKRTEVACEEKITRQQTPSVGLFNGALRAALASARMCSAAAKSSGNVSNGSAGMSPEIPVMSNAAKTEEFSPSELPQTQAEQEVTDADGQSSDDREQTLQTVINLLRESPERAHWSDADFRDAAQRRLAILDAAHREERQREAAKAAQESAASAMPPIPEAEEPIVEKAEKPPSSRQHEQISISLDAARLAKLRRQREKRKRPEQRRREFLAPLAVG